MVLIFKAEDRFLCLFSSLRTFRCLSFSFRREGLDLEDHSLRERKFDFNESLSFSRTDFVFFHLGSDSFLLRNDFFFLVGIFQLGEEQIGVYL